MRGWIAMVRALLMCGLLALGACGDDEEPAAPDGDDEAAAAVPTREPEVTGRLEVADGVVRLVEPSDTYFTEMVLVSTRRDDEVLVVDEGGDALAVEDLDDGMLVDVWVGGACAESYPVQCDIEALRVDLAS
jgi:hypothetical protein